MRASDRLTLLTLLVVVGTIFVVDRMSRPRPDLARLEKSIDTAKAQRAVAIETVTIYVPRAAAAKAKSDSADAAVIVADDTLLAVRLTPSAPPTLVVVPMQVTRDLLTLRQTVDVQALAIGALKTALAADSLVIRRQDSLIAAMRPNRCGPKCGGAIATAALLTIRLLTK